MRRLTTCFLLVLLAAAVNAMDVSPGGRLSILTCSPGDQIYSCFGHSAIRYRDVIDGVSVDVVYNYGMFDSFEENFELKFMSGNLLYELGKEDYRRFAALYAYERRGVVEQELDVKPADLQLIVDFLEENYLPENRKYHYHFFYDNCSSRLRDLLVSIFGDRLVIPIRDMGETTFRNMIDPYLEPFGWTDFGIDLVLGMPTDKQLDPLDEAFLPDFLQFQMGSMLLDGSPLVKGERRLLPQQVDLSSEGMGPTGVMWIAALVLIGLLIVMHLFQKRSGWLRSLIWTLMGLLGLVVFLMWTVTDHDTTRSNLNILFASPLLLVLVFLKQGRVKRWILILSTLGVVVFLAGWSLLPQQFHPATIPLALLILTANLTSKAFPLNGIARVRK